MRYSLCLLQISFIFFILTGFPPKSTGTTAFVLLVINSSILFSSIFPSLFISQKTGIASFIKTAFEVAAKVIGVVMTSSSFFKPIVL